jgi:hypothetical protein
VESVEQFLNFLQGDFRPAPPKSDLSPRWNEKAGLRGMRYAPGYALAVQRRPSMKKRSSSQKSQKVAVKAKVAQEHVTIGMDLGDKTSRYFMLGNEGEILREGQVATAKTGIVEAFGSLGRVRIAIEVGTHSPWVSRLLLKLGHEVIVANPRQVKLITESSRKDDRLDAQTLARLARIDPQLLRPIQHRSEKAQTALMVIRVRAALIVFCVCIVLQWCMVTLGPATCSASVGIDTSGCESAAPCRSPRPAQAARHYSLRLLPPHYGLFWKVSFR